MSPKKHLSAGLALCLAVFLAFCPVGKAQSGSNFWPRPSQISADSWLLIDLSTGQTLASLNENQLMHPGGLT